MTRSQTDGPQQYRGAPRAGRRAFTLVEVLVVVLILSILTAVALPLYLSGISTSARRTARYNLQTLITAEQAYRLQSPTHQYAENLDDLCPVSGGPDPLKVLSSCPAGPSSAVYTLYLGGKTLPDPDKRTVPTGSVAACAEDPSGNATKYGCFIPGQDNE